MPALFSLSYLLKPPWPHNPFNIVMEEIPDACDLYIDRSFCCSLSGSDDNEPGHRPEARDAVIERRVLEVIASFLSGCHGRPCHALDFGANNGWMTLAMLGMGAAVTSVEPQPDLAAAVRASATLNCHGARSTVLNVYACPSYRSANWRCLRKRQPKGHWRGAGGMPLAKMGLTSDHGKMRRAATGSVPNVTGVSIEDIIYSHLTGAGVAVAGIAVPGAAVADSAAAGMAGAAGAIRRLAAHFDLIKMDGDGPESSWLAALEDLFSGKLSGTWAATGRSPLTLTVDAIILEVNRGSPPYVGTLRRMQKVHGYDIYRMNGGETRRLITPSGWDAFSPLGTFAPLTRRRSRRHDSLEDEILTARAMHHLFRYHQNLTLEQWSTALEGCAELLLVHRRVMLLPPRGVPSFAWKGSKKLAPEATGVDLDGVVRMMTNA